MRVYVPLTLEDLAAHHGAGEVPAGQDRVVAGSDDEESEFVAVHADAVPGAAPDDDLGWFAAQEVPALLDGGL